MVSLFLVWCIANLSSYYHSLHLFFFNYLRGVSTPSRAKGGLLLNTKKEREFLRALFWTRRESNPRLIHAMDSCYHYTTGPWCAREDSNL